jgi:hypothetical protein
MKAILMPRQHGKITVRDVGSITGANRNTIKAHIEKWRQTNY